MIQKQKLILIGGGGHCKSVIDVIESKNEFEIIGIIDKEENFGQSILGYNIFGNDNDIPKYVNEGINFCITVGQIKSEKLRVSLYNSVLNAGGNLPIIISSNAHVSKHSRIAKGTVIMHNAIVNADSEIGSNCIINTKALIEHDCKTGNNCHISTNAIVNGACNIGDNCFIGSNVVLNNGITVCDNVIIGAGSLVTKNIFESGVYVGSPARKIN